MKIRFQILLIIAFLSTKFVNAQSLIAGIPSADVAPDSTIMITHESQLNSWKYEDVKWNSFNFICYGIGHNTEFSITFSNLSNQPVSHESFGVGFKKIFPLDFIKIPESKIVFGQNVLFAVDRPTVGGWSYAMASARIPKIKTRLTGGISYGSAELFGYDTVTTVNGNQKVSEIKRLNPFSYMVGFEQPIIEDKFSIIADWFSGRHDLAALITGVQFDFHNIVLIGGYKFPNYSPVKNGAIIFEVMYEF